MKRSCQKEPLCIKEWKKMNHEFDCSKAQIGY